MGGATYQTKRGELSRTMDAVWLPEDERRLRAFVRAKFSERTPPKDDDIYSFDWRSRVGRSEMRSWAASTLGKLPPETDPDWLVQFASWYRRMGRRIMKKAVDAEQE